MFGYTNVIVRGLFGLCVVLGTYVLMLTVSRISAFGLIVALGLVLLFQKKKLVLYAIPVAIIGAFLVLSHSPGLVQRFGSTLTQVDILVDTATGNPIGQVSQVPKTYFKDKVVRQQFSKNIDDISTAASVSASFDIPYALLSDKMLLYSPVSPTGEDLPSGTGYINLTLSPVVKKINQFLYEPREKTATSAAQVFVINGPYIVKKTFAYDLSFTTRFQGEWPNAVAAFKRNILLGSGYGSVSLAVDNSYLRMLAETGMLGLIAFVIIFVIAGMYIKNALPSVDSKPVKSFVLGIVAGVVGLAINAVFIDVFEASKVAFSLWLLLGVSLGFLALYKPGTPRVSQRLIGIITSSYAVAVYLLLTTFVLFSPVLTNYFVGDDFTWFRWAAKSVDIGAVVRFFTQSDGFFYRPGTKVYFQAMYQFFWLNQTAYHTVSLFLHFMVSVLVYFLAKKIFRTKLLSVISAFVFLLLSGFAEVIFWVSATGFLFTSVCILLSVLSYIAWTENRKGIYMAAALAFSVLSLLFHELGIVTPFLCVLYLWTMGRDKKFAMHWWLFLPLPLYAVVRFVSHSHWFSGDYSYNIIKFPLNAAGNFLGYFLMTVLGPFGIRIDTVIRGVLQAHLLFAFIICAGAAYALYLAGRRVFRYIPLQERALVVFSVGFSVIALAPFLGLGNIASRYGYLASIGFVFLLVYVANKAYIFLSESGRTIAVLIMSILVGVFGLYQMVVLQQLQGDWHEAGEQVKRFVISMESSYEDYWAVQPMQFHFVSVPIRHGEAWVFPVGLPDAVWFVFRNPNAHVYMWPDVPSALNAVQYNSKTQKVFLFAADGSVTAVIKPPPTIQ